MNAVMNETTETNKSTELAAVQTAVAKMDAFTLGLAELSKRFKGVIFDVTTTKGMKEAKEARREIAAPRIEVEKIRKAAKAPILELGRMIDTEAARVTKELAALEEPIQQQIVREENRIEAERQAKIDAEKKRVEDIVGRIDDMRGDVNGSLRCRTSAEVQRILTDLEATAITAEVFQEYFESAEKIKAVSITEIRSILAEFVAREEQAAQLAKDRAELGRQRDEQAKEAQRRTEVQERLDELRGCPSLTPSSGTKLISEHIEDLEKLPVTEEIFGSQFYQAIDAKKVGLQRLNDLFAAARAHEAEQARLTAEREAQAAESRRLAQEREAFEAQQRAAREAEEARQQAERDAEATRLRDEAAAREEAERVAEEQRRRNYRPTTAEMVAVMVEHYDRDAKTIYGWLREAFAELPA